MVRKSASVMLVVLLAGCTAMRQDKDCKWALTGPSFEFDKAILTAEGRQHVEHAIVIMREQPTLVVVVEGHTDSIGSDAYNMKLSQRRANAVRDYMVKNGVSGSRIKTEAYGKTRPIASNKTAEGRAQNRRVDIVTQ